MISTTKAPTEEQPGDVHQIAAGLHRPNPPLRVGESVWFIDGGPRFQVAGLDGPDYVTVTWPEGNLLRELKLHVVLCTRKEPAQR